MTMSAILDQARAMLAREAGEGVLPTAIPFLSLIRYSRPTALNRGILSPSICLIVQGRKLVHVGSSVIPYGEGEYLVATVDMPAAGQVVQASPERPYIGLRLGLDPLELAEIAREAGMARPVERRAVAGAFAEPAGPEVVDALARLLKLAGHPRDAAMLAGMAKREILYRLLTGPNGHLFYQNLLLDAHEQGVGKAIVWIKQHYAEPLVVEQLAKVVNMSVSSLHHKFKDVTAMGPLQYQKQLRLQEARRLLSTGAVSAATAAQRVGYDSESQFSREYRRLFGAPPMRDTRLKREQPTEV